ncbi:DegT/DnrJ/EryC1/StrS family aminotransferase [Halalkalibacter kiskunsagensis]|uniref:DegT/DnrJ/EryC1/StrS family aminotransferase n=1 Tax=Halalkalibacter kiskunsagensis TaxID=1548599 RepID=A0ABV6K9S3_9BACI
MNPLFKKPVYVSKPLLPPLKDYFNRLQSIWDSEWLTNNGEQHQEFEKRLADYLEVPYVSLFSNGTTALTVAYKSLHLTGEVITTPFTFPATPYSLSWIGLKPVFCDIDLKTMNIDANRIESLITKETSAILGVHVFGVPCEVKKIESIAKKYNLKVIYDAAHAFGVKVNGKPIGSFGDISMMSLHATKLFHTAEGGALLFKSEESKKRADLIKNFGIETEDLVSEVGINGKMSELQAALGLTVLEQVKGELKRRETLTKVYRNLLRGIKGIEFIEEIEGVQLNHQYFPIRINEKVFGRSRDYVYSKLRENNVYARRYFYPLCSNFPFYKKSDSSRSELKAAETVSEQTLILPLYGELTEKDIDMICNIIIREKNGAN